MVEELSERTTLMCPTCLCAIDRIKGLVQEEPNGPAQIDPWRAVSVERRIVP